MERLTAKNGEFYFYPQCFKEECDGVSEPCSECEFEEKICMRLGEYEDTGITPEQIMEMKGPIGKLQKHFGNTITVGQVIDFFVDFYIAQGDPDRVEAAELLTNEEVARYKELKERDTAKMCKQSIFDHDSITCVCRSDLDKDVEFMFCPWCGQRLKKWEE